MDSKEEIEQLKQRLTEAERQRDAHADLASERRRALQACEQERDEWRRAAHMNSGIYESLQRQLATVTAERDRLREERETQP